MVTPDGSLIDLWEIKVITGQSAFLLMVVVGMLSLPLALAWVVIDSYLGDRRDRMAAACVPTLGTQAGRAPAGPVKARLARPR
jgi:hypothetical protein